MKKRILLFLMIIISAFTINVKADENILFNKETFVNFFEKKNFKITYINSDELPHMENNWDCEVVSAIHPANNKAVELFVFENEEKAYDYFKYVYEDNLDLFSEIETYNLDKELDSKYSYVKTILSELYYFYLVKIDNYVIKSNTEIETAHFMNKIYDELGFIENTENKNNLIPILILSSIILIIVIIFIISKIKTKSKKEVDNNNKIEEK